MAVSTTGGGLFLTIRALLFGVLLFFGNSHMPDLSLKPTCKTQGPQGLCPAWTPEGPRPEAPRKEYGVTWLLIPVKNLHHIYAE